MTQQSKELVPTSGFDRFIELALDKAVPVETLERLLGMQKEIMAANAKAAFDEAMRAFQKDCPIIQKHKRVMNKDGQSVRYFYAPLDDIIEQVKGPLADHGFSYRLGQEVDKPKVGWLTVSCTATHALGHSETEKFELPLGAAQFMTAQQEVGAARTFGSRYCFLGVFGIMTGDEDNDANSIEPAKKETQAPSPTPKPDPAPVPNTSGQLTITGIVTNITQNEKNDKKGFRYCIHIDKERFYTFDKKVAENAKEYAAGGPATIVYTVGAYGNDIKALTFVAMPKEAPLDEYKGELEKK